MRALIVVSIVVGAGLRLALPTVFTYLDDERWTFEHVASALHGDDLATLGMPSSTGVRNAPLSVWAFVALGWIGGVSTPVGLTRAVAVLGLGALVAGLALLPRLVPTEGEREVWTWGLVLTSTNPMIVFLERKIWAQSLLPAVDVALLCAWMRREKAAASFAWGLLGSMAGQIHMAGFCFAGALAGATRWRETPARTRWAPWAAGAALGMAPAVPWLSYLARERPRPNAAPWWLRFRLEFYQYFFSDPSAMTTPYVVGSDAVLAMRYPLVAGRPTYLVGAAFACLAVASTIIGLRALRHAWAGRADAFGLLVGDRSETGILLAAALVGMGGIMTLPSISIYRHYMLAAFPLPYVWAARAALREGGGGKLLGVLFAGGLVVSAGTLSFIADHDGAQEFGKDWAAQVRDRASSSRQTPSSSVAEDKHFREGIP